MSRRHPGHRCRARRNACPGSLFARRQDVSGSHARVLLAGVQFSSSIIPTCPNPSEPNRSYPNPSGAIKNWRIEPDSAPPSSLRSQSGGVRWRTPQVLRSTSQKRIRICQVLGSQGTLFSPSLGVICLAQNEPELSAEPSSALSIIPYRGPGDFQNLSTFQQLAVLKSLETKGWHRCCNPSAPGRRHDCRRIPERTVMRISFTRNRSHQLKINTWRIAASTRKKCSL
jgi:hypothetical protein